MAGQLPHSSLLGACSYGAECRAAIKSGHVPPSLYPVCIGRPVDNQSGAVRPVNALETPTVSPALRPLSLAVASAECAARGYTA